jgi:hypothetical protein
MCFINNPMDETQKAHHIGRDRSLSYPFPDMAYHATPYDGFFMRDMTNFRHTFISKGLGYLIYLIVNTSYREVTDFATDPFSNCISLSNCMKISKKPKAPFTKQTPS